MTFSNEWMSLREELLPERPSGDSVVARRSAGIRRWLRECRDDPSCSVAEAVEHVRRSHAEPERPRRSAGAWREFLRESGDIDDDADVADAGYLIAGDAAEDEPSLAESLLAE